VLVAVAAAGTDWGAVSAIIPITTNALAHVLFDDFILAFEAVSVLLLAAVIGGVFLAKREREQGA
jgi:NADH:ubiquinone oxidoreductase subunit 6 (subunit J)